MGITGPQALVQVRYSQLFVSFTSALVKHYIRQISFRRSFRQATQENYSEDGAGFLFVSPVPVTAYGPDGAWREWQRAPRFVICVEA